MGSWKGIVTTLGKRDYASAGPTRNNLIRCFQNKNLDVLSDHIDQHVFQFVESLERRVHKGEKIDGVMWSRRLALDIVTDVLWGEDTDLLGHVDEAKPDFLRRFFAFSKYNALKSFIPAVELIVKYLGPPEWSKLRQDCLDLDVTAKQALARWDEKQIKTHDQDVLSMLSSMEDNDEPRNRILREHLPAYMVEMMVAGSSTTSHTAAFACWALATHPEAQQRLRQELFDLSPDPARIEMKAMQQSEWLDCVIKETIRIRPMIPGPLERYLGKSIEVNGLQIPAGVIASTSALTSGRNPDVYHEPGQWRPEICANANETMGLNFTPFGFGYRICSGSNRLSQTSSTC